MFRPRCRCRGEGRVARVRRHTTPSWGAARRFIKRCWPPSSPGSRLPRAVGAPRIAVRGGRRLPPCGARKVRLRDADRAGGGDVKVRATSGTPRNGGAGCEEAKGGGNARIDQPQVEGGRHAGSSRPTAATAAAAAAARRAAGPPPRLRDAAGRARSARREQRTQRAAGPGRRADVGARSAPTARAPPRLHAARRHRRRPASRRCRRRSSSARARGRARRQAGAAVARLIGGVLARGEGGARLCEHRSDPIALALLAPDTVEDPTPANRAPRLASLLGPLRPPRRPPPRNSDLQTRLPVAEHAILATSRFVVYDELMGVLVRVL